MTFSDAVNYLERLCPPGQHWSLEVRAHNGYPGGVRQIEFMGSFAEKYLPHWDTMREKYDKRYDSLDDIVRDLTAGYLSTVTKTEAEIGKVDVK